MSIWFWHAQVLNEQKNMHIVLAMILNSNVSKYWSPLFCVLFLLYNNCTITLGITLQYMVAKD